jgi:type II secretion system-associated lipoprotein
MLFFLLPLCACASFITKPEETRLKEKEKNVYILKKDIDLETKKLKKGDAVKILIATSRGWVKAYAYPVRVDKLKAERFLLLYLFEDEFANKEFSIDLFNEKLDALVALKDEKAPPEKKPLKIRNK